MATTQVEVANDIGDLGDPVCTGDSWFDGLDCVGSKSRCDVDAYRAQAGYLVVAKGSIGRLNNRTFLVDTGTSRTLVDSSVAKQLQLTGVAHKLTVFDHEVEVRLVDLPDLQLGAIRAQSPQVIVTNLSGVAPRFGLHADAIIGTDILRLGSFAIDYDSRRIWFGDNEPIPLALPSNRAPI
jgi:Aspartyl protease